MTDERREELLSAWEHETIDEDSQDWREDLTLEELVQVRKWDRTYDRGVSRLIAQILALEEELKGGGAHGEAAG
jgi:hypothetical protein